MDRAIHVIGLTALVSVLIVVFTLFIPLQCGVSTDQMKRAQTANFLNNLSHIDIAPRATLSERALAAAMSEENQDWSPCSCDGGELRDAWKTRIRVVVDQQTPGGRLQSAGLDARFDTEDDLVRAIVTNEMPNKSPNKSR